MTELPFIRRVAADQSTSGAGRWCLFINDRLLVLQDGSGVRLPDTMDIMATGMLPTTTMPIGDRGDVQYLIGILPEMGVRPPFEAVDLRRAHELLSEQDYGIAGYAAQIAYWDRTTRFCPVCGATTERDTAEWSKYCPNCHFRQYPRVSPAIIVLVYRPGQVLLTRQPSWPPNRYSLVAGFVEAGESLEACVRREVAEEVGVRVGRIQYLGSQPWPFPHQLMVGFVAEYCDGDVVVQETELEHAAWFDLDALPALPPPMSISRRIIDWHLAVQHTPDHPFPEDPY